MDVTREGPRRPRRAGALRIAMLVLGVGSAAGCHPTEPVQDIGSANLTTLVQVDPVSRTDTTYVGDVFTIPMPHFRDAAGKARSDFSVTRTTNAATIARPNESETKVVANATGGETFADEQLITIEAVGAGDARLQIAPILTDPKLAPVGAAGVTTPTGAPLVFTHNVIVLANKPTILDVPSVIRMQVGDTMTLAAMPRGSSGGAITTGQSAWQFQGTAGVATLHPMVLLLDVWPNTLRYPSQPALVAGGTGRIGLKAARPGQDELVGVWASAGGARVQKNVTVIVTARGTATIFADGSANVDDPARAREAVDVGATRQFSLRDGNNVTISQALIEWVSSAATVADITPSGATGGKATCRSVGTTTIQATVPSTGQSATASLRCGNDAPKVTIAISPATASVKVGSTVTFDATAVDPLVLSSIKWSASSNAVVVSAVSSTPLTSRVTVLGVRPGQSSVVAEYGANTAAFASATATLTITPRTLRLVPATTPTPIAAGAPLQYAIEEVDAAANRIGSIPAAQFEWSSSATAIAQIDANGKATCAATGTGGTTTITATQAVTGEKLTATLACDAPAGYTLATGVVTAVPGQGVTAATIAVTRTGGLTAGIAITGVTGAPAGLTVTPSATSFTGNSLGLNVTATTAVGVGTYPITINTMAVGTTLTQTTTLTVTVSSSAGVQIAALYFDPRDIELTAPTSVTVRARLFDAQGNQVAIPAGGTITYALASLSSNPAAAITPLAGGLALVQGRVATAPGLPETLRATYTPPAGSGGKTLTDQTSLTVYASGAVGHYGAVELLANPDVRRLKVGDVISVEILVRDVNGIKLSGCLPGTTDCLDFPSTGTAAERAAIQAALQITRDTSKPGFVYAIKALAATGAAGVALRADMMGAAGSAVFVVTP